MSAQKNHFAIVGCGNRTSESYEKKELMPIGEPGLLFFSPRPPGPSILRAHTICICFPVCIPGESSRSFLFAYGFVLLVRYIHIYKMYDFIPGARPLIVPFAFQCLPVFIYIYLLFYPSSSSYSGPIVGYNTNPH